MTTEERNIRTILTGPTPISLNFLQWISKLFRQLLTGRDNRTHDIMRWAFAIAFIFMIVLVVYQEWSYFHADAALVKEKVFQHNSVKDVAQSFAILFGGGGLGIFLKRDAEPDQEVRPGDKS